jgi:predicted transcriptional regulator
MTVDKVMVGISSESFPATYQRTAYVAATRGREQVQIFTDDRKELLKAVSRPDDPISATELSLSSSGKTAGGVHVAKRLAMARGLGVFAAKNDGRQPDHMRDARAQAEIDHVR